MTDVVARFGGLDILVNNAGITTVGDIESLSYAAFRHELDVDLSGTFLGCQAAVRTMAGAAARSSICPPPRD